jgi:hypothetical protein
MKNKITLLTTMLLFFSFALAQAQYVGAVVDYMKVKPGHNGDYLEVEMEWKKIHEARVKQGHIIQWVLWEKMFAGADDPYHYMTVAIFDDFKKTENSFPVEWVQDNLTEKELDDLMKRTGESRTLVKTEVFHQVAFAENQKPSEYMMLNTMKVTGENEGYYQYLESEIYKPLQEAAIEKGYRSGWSIWSKWPRPVDDYQFITVDGYSEYGQWMTGENLLEAVHPDKTWEEINKMSNEARTHLTSELWRLVDVVVTDDE